MTESARPVALITGGTGGVGSAACRILTERGHDVEFTFRNNVKQAARVSAVTGRPGLRLDLGDATATTRVIDDVAARHGRLDVLVHAAGPYVHQRYVSQFTSEQFVEHVHGELIAFHHVAAAALPHLRTAGGNIVAVTTFAVRKFPPRDALSSIPKAGIEAMLRAIAVEEGKFGVRANWVGPGALADGMTLTSRATGDIPQELLDEAARSIPLRRLGTAEEVARAACFLASAEASYITGQYLDVDGGFQL